MRNEHLAQSWNCGWTSQAQAEPQRKHSYRWWKQSPYFYVILYYIELSRRYISIQVCSQFNVTTTRYVKHEHPRCKARSSLATSHHTRTSIRPPSWRQTSQNTWRNFSWNRCPKKLNTMTLASGHTKQETGQWLPLLLLSPDCTASFL